MINRQFHKSIISYKNLTMRTKLHLLTILLGSCLQIFAQTPVKLSSGQFGFAEGPVWDRDDKIYFSDIQTRKVEIYSITDNTFSTAYTATGRTNGLMFDKDMNLIVCEFQRGEVTEKTTTGVLLETYANGFTNPNDLCIDKEGGIYVSTPNTKEIYYISPEPNRTKTLIDNTLNFPNGVIISNDGKTLIVSDSQSYDIYKFDINPSTGLISNKSVFATLTDYDNTDTRSLADGMAIDTNGNLYVTAKKSLQIFDASGTKINSIAFDENITNCTFGGSDLSTLFVTAPNDFYKIDFTGVTGFQHPFDLPESSLSLDKNEKYSFNIFPNPSADHIVNIEVGNTEIDEIILYNNLGAKIGSYNFERFNNSIKVDLGTNLKSNIYILTLTTKDGSAVHNKIVLK
ncbi:hypothetical protein GCM10007028_18240 [Algibacter mikhailovii]|uniref:T9SS type A sorting domain-containing protein n=2 Tax=Algibacter mikhailovii TaxID=425498 RepID=A0A918R1R2_9FLAO|nr:hypothetical protein GCM10007028_18240 [Algibacter mikhailovii]